jgi:hypothetical protein
MSYMAGGISAGPGGEMTALIYKTYVNRGYGYPEGLHVQQLIQLLRNKGVNMGEDEVRRHIKILYDEGEIYENLHDYHKPTCEN